MGRSEEVAIRDVPVPESLRPYRYLSPLGGLLAGSANFTMQLAWPAVGYAVANSRVPSGSALRHPVKRGRTTFTYLSVAVLGSDEDRAVFRKAINGQHAQVVSTPEEPVEYRAMDPQLQTWVAACLYFGWVDMLEKMYGPLPDDEADGLYAFGARLGTTLQMPAAAWPPDRAAFARYWDEGLAKVQIDEPVREHLMKLIGLDVLPRPLRTPAAKFNVFVTTGFLPPVVRDAMELPWTDAQQAKFETMMRRLGRVEGMFPRSVRALPFYLLLWDMRLRRRLGLRLV